VPLACPVICGLPRNVIIFVPLMLIARPVASDAACKRGFLKSGSIEEEK